MNRDVLNAVVELVTNADDSYTRLESAGIQGFGTVEIEVNPSTREITVCDSAEGMSAEDLVRCLGEPGSKTNEYNKNQQVRGFFGRGATDVAALGVADWQSTRDGETNHLRVEYTDDGKAPWKLSHISDAPPDAVNSTVVRLRLRSDKTSRCLGGRTS